MVTLDGIALGQEDSTVLWVDRYTSQGVEQNMRRTLGGRLVIMTGVLVSGQPITLQATDNYGWISKNDGDALRALAADPNDVHELVYGSETHSVMFDHSSGPAVELHPLVEREEPGAEDYMTGQIKLITV